MDNNKLDLKRKHDTEERRDSANLDNDNSGSDTEDAAKKLKKSNTLTSMPSLLLSENENENKNEKKGKKEDEEEKEQRSTSLKRIHSSENLSDDSENENENKEDDDKKIQQSASLASQFTLAGTGLFAHLNNKNKQKDSTTTTKAEPGNGTGSSMGMGYKFMKQMGYKDGQGIGKDGQGRVKPVDESNQVGKKGLGFKHQNFEEKVHEWDYDTDQVNADERVEWLKNNKREDSPGHVQMLERLRTLEWRKMGRKKRLLDDEDSFCSKNTLKQVLECKSIFDTLDERDMRFARFRSNPFEAIGARFFQNRAALKMANLDAVFDFMFTNPRYPDGTSKIEANEPLYFCDVCAGPGGFSEYVLWRKAQGTAKGFGMTLKEDNDFSLEDFVAGQPEYFEPYYGQMGVNGDGDVTRAVNLKEFQKFVVEQTNHRGVHFMMADGGFSVEGNENIQEILSKQLYLCQFVCALSVLRGGGNFVCKIFDCFTPFSVGLIYLMHSCFDRVSLHKPVTSRPANSERYLVCESAREHTKNVVYDYLMRVNESLNETFRSDKSTQDVVELVPVSVMQADQEFYEYIYESNERLGRIQCLNLKKIQAFATNKNLFDPRQGDLIRDCLALWKIPELTREDVHPTKQNQNQQNSRFNNSGGNNNNNKKFKPPKVKANPVNYRALLDKLNSELQLSLGFDLNSLASGAAQGHILSSSEALADAFKKCSVYDFKSMMACGQLVLLLGCGRSTVFELQINTPLNCSNSNSTDQQQQTSTTNNKRKNNNDQWAEWKRLEDLNIELPRETLVLAEKCVEYRGIDANPNPNMQPQTSRAVHLMDVYFIEGTNMLLKDGGVKVSSMAERHFQLERFVKSIAKKSKSELCTIRLKDMVNVEKIDSEIIENFIPRKRKRKEESLSLKLEQAIHIPLSFASEYYVYPSGVYLFRCIRGPWSLIQSKSTGKQYYFNSSNGQSTYDFPRENKLFCDPRQQLENLLMWKFQSAIENETEEVVNGSGRISNERFIDFLKQHR